MSNLYYKEEQSASPFNSSMLSNKERSNSIQVSLGNGSASLYLPVTFSQDNINDLLNLANKFEVEEENEDIYEDSDNQDEDIHNVSSNNMSLCESN